MINPWLAEEALDEELQLYVQKRWNSLSDASKEILGLTDEDARQWMFLVWKKQYLFDLVVEYRREALPDD